MATDFPAEIEQFIGQHIESLAQLETLLLLRREPGAKLVVCRSGPAVVRDDGRMHGDRQRSGASRLSCCATRPTSI